MVLVIALISLRNNIYDDHSVFDGRFLKSPYKKQVIVYQGIKGASKKKKLNSSMSYAQTAFVFHSLVLLLTYDC